jgi:DNA (cytosine-5)-methyltransferase 1
MQKKNKIIKIVDLFAGIGGTRIGCEQATEELGLLSECVFTSELDDACRETYQNNFENSKINNDITKITNLSDKNIRNQIPAHNILLAGFPCQAFSHAGHKKGFNDTRGTLFFDILKVLEVKKPDMFLLENVGHLRGHDNGKTLKIMLKNLRSLGYNTPEPKILNAKDFGLPQNRRRIFIVGFKRKRINFNYPQESEIQTKVGDILEVGRPKKKYIISPKLWDSHQKRKKRNEEKGWGFGYSVFSKKDVYTRTLSARYYKDGSEILISRGKGREPRKLTPRECANLQGFPRNFTIHHSNIEAYKQFGNSVPVSVIKALCIEMISAYNAYL